MLLSSIRRVHEPPEPLAKLHNPSDKHARVGNDNVASVHEETAGDYGELGQTDPILRKREGGNGVELTSNVRKASETTEGPNDGEFDEGGAGGRRRRRAGET